MFTACELGVFDLLLESGQPLSLDVIAARLGTSIIGMERLLDACVGLKLLAVELRRDGGKEGRQRGITEWLRLVGTSGFIWLDSSPAGPPRAGCPDQCPGSYWRSPRRRFYSLWAACTFSPAQHRSALWSSELPVFLFVLPLPLVLALGSTKESLAPSS